MESCTRRLSPVIGLLVIALFVLFPPAAAGYECSEPHITGQVGPIAEDGSFVLRVDRTDPGVINPARFNVYFRGQTISVGLPQNPHYLTLDASCMTEPSELRVVPLNCYSDEYAPGAWSTTVSPVSTAPSVRMKVEKRPIPPMER